MKRSLLILTTAVMAMVFVSCNLFPKSVEGIKMDTPQATEKVIESLKGNINFDEWKIYEIYWCEGEKLENELSIMSVKMVNKSNDCFVQTFLLGGDAAGNASELRKVIGQTAEIDFASLDAITPDMINPELFQKQYDQAKTMIPAEQEFRSVERCDMRITVPSGNSFFDSGKKFGVFEHEFTLNTVKPGKEYIESAGKKSLQYLQFKFNTLPDGSVKLVE